MLYKESIRFGTLLTLAICIAAFSLDGHNVRAQDETQADPPPPDKPVPQPSVANNKTGEATLKIMSFKDDVTTDVNLCRQLDSPCPLSVVEAIADLYDDGGLPKNFELDPAERQKCIRRYAREHALILFDRLIVPTGNVSAQYDTEQRDPALPMLTPDAGNLLRDKIDDYLTTAADEINEKHDLDSTHTLLTRQRQRLYNLAGQVFHKQNGNNIIKTLKKIEEGAKSQSERVAAKLAIQAITNRPAPKTIR